MKTVPYRKGLPLIGTTLNIVASGSASKFHLYIDERHKQLGPIFKENMGNVEGIFLAEPKSARAIFTAEGKYPKHVIPTSWEEYNKMYKCDRGLFFMHGEKWLKHRQIMNRWMLKNNSTPSEVHEFVVGTFVESMDKYLGKHIHDIEHNFYGLSITYLIGTLMGSTFMNHMEDLKKDIDSLASVVNSIFSTTSKLMHVPISFASTLGFKDWTEFTRAVQTSLSASRTLVERMSKYSLKDGLLKDLLDEDIEPEIINDLVMDLILAAGDTTSSTSQWALYLLSKEPEVADRVRRNSKLVTGVVKEALRLYPAAIFISRYLDKDLYLGNLDCSIPEGELVMLSMYTLGRLESAYIEPLKFLPERWLRKENSIGGEYQGVLDPMAWLPFAIGARSCVGRKLAETQLSLTVSKMLSRYRLQLMEPVDMELRMVPVPSKPLKIQLERL